MPRRNGTDRPMPPERIGWRYRYCVAATPNANVLTASSSPRARSAPTPTSAASPAVIERGEQDREHDGQRLDAGLEDASVTPADVDADAAGERRGEERADPGERHLAERQLAGPPGEDRQRQPQSAKHEDRGVEQVPRRLGDDDRQDDRGDPEQRPGPSRSSWRTHHDRRSCSGIGRRFGANENVCVSPAARRGSGRRPRRARRRAARKSIRPGLVEEVEADQRLHDADRDAGDEGAGERHHAGDHRGDERAHQRVRAERGEVRRRARSVRRSATSRASTDRRRPPTRTATRSSG